MSTTTGLIVTVALLLGCIGSDAVSVASGVTVEFTCTGPADSFLPTWLVNGTPVVSSGNICYRSTSRRNPGELNATVTLTINGNRTCNTFDIYCRILKGVHLYVHNTTLVVQGPLPSPESIHIYEHFNSSTIEWRPPYSSMNNDTIHVDPHITQYTVYITDNYTGNVIVKKNVAEMRFTFNASDNGSCPMYQISAWNAGGEGKLSEKMQGSSPNIPRSIAAGNVITTAASQVLHIDLHVSELCKTKMPNRFAITVTTSGRVVVNTTTVQYDHQSGPQVAIRIKLPQNVDMCSLFVSISAGNSAGMSSPTEVEVECPPINDSSDNTPTTSTGTDRNTSVITDGARQGEDNTIVPVSVGVTIAVLVIMAAVGVTACVTFTIWKGSRKGEKIPCTSSPAAAPSGSSGIVYADVEALQRKIKPPPEDDIVQYQTVLPQPAIPEPKLPPKSGVPSDTTPPGDETLRVPAFAGGEEEGLGMSSK